ncbi:hypothetical protein [Streptomyces sp. NPDC093225]|uniref:hypothetical protein n=1 Tax=Streptomyces sp. NPDC093225 TaxID=3366034 RepID=UPI003814F69D
MDFQTGRDSGAPGASPSVFVSYDSSDSFLAVVVAGHGTLDPAAGGWSAGGVSGGPLLIPRHPAMSAGPSRLTDLTRRVLALTVFDDLLAHALDGGRTEPPRTALAELFEAGLGLDPDTAASAARVPGLAVPHGSLPEPWAVPAPPAFATAPRPAGAAARTAGTGRAPAEAAEVHGALVLSAGSAAPARAAEAVAQLLHRFRPRADLAPPLDRTLTLAALAEAAAALRAELTRCLQLLLRPAAYEYEDHVPPNGCSPCGVIRMAATAVPRGPQPALHARAAIPRRAPAA